MEFGVMIYDMTYVVVAIIWGRTHVYQINLNPVKEFCLHNRLKGSFSGVRSCLLACGACLTKLLYITPWPVKSCRTDLLKYCEILFGLLPVVSTQSNHIVLG